jgi:hypothetical protein
LSGAECRLTDDEKLQMGRIGMNNEYSKQTTMKDITYLDKAEPILNKCSKCPKFETKYCDNVNLVEYLTKAVNRYLQEKN